MAQLGFRARLLVILSLFALVPAVVLTFAWGGTMTQVLPLMAGTAAWDSVSATGDRALGVARRGVRSPSDSIAVDDHRRALSNSVTMSRRFELLTARAPQALFVASLVLVAMLVFLATRAAGHLSRQLSRPIDELVAWTEAIARGAPLPDATARGAPEFGVLRARMQRMAKDLDAGRRAALEAERLRAMRETSRQVAHELKNPLTPIRFAIDRLRGRVPAELAETVEVLASESARLDAMARSFSQFGRLPDGPVADVDVPELLASAIRTAVPASHHAAVSVAPGTPTVLGDYEALARAVVNVLANAVEATPAGATVEVLAAPASLEGREAAAITVRDAGPGVPDAKLGVIWEPYVTSKAGGTGLGLAIVKQTVEAHGGTVAARRGPAGGLDVILTLPSGAARGVT